jgi:uncharacterized cupredoxin-like copper-binding protein
MRAPVLPTVTVTLCLALAGCGTSGSSSSGKGQKATVKAGDSTCALSSTDFAAGKVELEVQNTGKDVTEVYVYAKSDKGAFDKVVGEVENIAPGATRDLDVTLGGGDYEVACKPGQKGDGIRTKLTVSGAEAAGDDDAKYDREVEVTAKEYAFTGLAGFTAKVGEKIEFKLENKGTMQHELEILGPDGKDVGEVGPTDAGEDGEVVIELTTAGTYTYLCGIADHASRGMKGTFTVS